MIMSKQFTVRTYRFIDLTLFAVILIICESVIILAATGPLFRDQAFTVSLAAAVTAIVYMRWGYRGAIHAALAGIVTCVMSGGSFTHLMIYGIGNLLSVLMVPVIRKTGCEKILKSKYCYLLIGLGTLLLMQTGRAFVALICGSRLSDIIRFFTTDSLSAVFTLVILFIAHRLDGVTEDQIHYLNRINRETGN